MLFHGKYRLFSVKLHGKLSEYVGLFGSIVQLTFIVTLLFAAKAVSGNEPKENLNRGHQASWWNTEYDYRIKAVVDSGMYIREDYVLSLLIDFVELLGADKSFDVNSVRVVDLDTGKIVPFSFQADEKKGNSGVLKWMMQGKVEPLAEKNYFIYFSNEKTSLKENFSFPDIDLGDDKNNLVANPGFENDGRWTTKSRPDKNVFAKFTEKQSSSGKRSLVISKHNGNIVSWKSHSEIFEIHPDTHYALSGKIKIDELQATNDGYAIICFQFLDARKQVRKPPREKNHRMCIAQRVGPNRAEKNDFLRTWVDRKTSSVTPRWAKYGMIKISIARLSGTVYFDDVTVTKVRHEPAAIALCPLETYKNRAR